MFLVEFPWPEIRPRKRDLGPSFVEEAAVPAAAAGGLRMMAACDLVACFARAGRQTGSDDGLATAFRSINLYLYFAE